MTLSSNPTATANRVAVEIHLQLARVTLARPPLNVIDFQMMDELLAALQQLEQRKEVSVVIISGGERAFSAGVDVAVHTPDQVQTMLQKFHGVILALTRSPKITIAEVRGACLRNRRGRCRIVFGIGVCAATTVGQGCVAPGICRRQAPCPIWRIA